MLLLEMLPAIKTGLSQHLGVVKRHLGHKLPRLDIATALYLKEVATRELLNLFYRA